MRTVAVSLRQVTLTFAVVGIVAAVGLFEWKSHTSYPTVGTTTLSCVAVVLGLITVVVAMIDLVRSRGDWLPLVAVILGTLTWASVLFVGYPT